MDGRKAFVDYVFKVTTLKNESLAQPLFVVKAFVNFLVSGSSESFFPEITLEHLKPMLFV